MFYLDLFRTLEEEKVRYLLVGSLAANLHGGELSTMNVDMMPALDTENLQRFFNVAKRLHLKPAAPVTLEQFFEVETWSSDERMSGFSLRSSDGLAPSIDVLVKPAVLFEPAYERRAMMRLGEATIDVAASEDLVALKSGASHLDRYEYELTDEQLLYYSSLPAAAKLQWLDEARQFTLLAREARIAVDHGGAPTREPSAPREP